MIPAILFFLVLLMPPFFLSVRRGKRFEETIALSSGSMILFMFVCGMAGLLKISVYMILGITAILAGASVLTVIRKKQVRAAVAPFFTPAFFAFFLVFVSLLYLHYERLLHEYDEFTHWGDVVKAMAYIDDFATSPASHSLFQSYVPGMSLFQYLFEKIAMILPGGIFTDWRLYFSYHLLAFIFLLPFFTVRNLKLFVPAFAVIVCTAVSPAFLTEKSSYLTAIYIDGFVGLLAGAGFAFLFVKKRTGNSIAHILVICSMLVLSKDVGMLFALALAAAFAVTELRESRGAGKAGRKKLLIMLSLAIAAIAVPKILWEISIRVNNAEVRFREPVDLGVLFNVLTGRDTSYLAAVPGKCFGKLMTGWVAVQGIQNTAITYPALAILLAALLWAARKYWADLDPDGKFRHATAAWAVVLVFVIYCLGMPVLYMFRFGQTGATNLSSFDRYMSIAFGCVTTTVLLVFAAGLQARPERLRRGAVVFLLVTVLSLTPVTLLEYLNRQSVTDQYYVQGNYETLVNPMKTLADGEEKHVWIIAQESDGFEYWPIRYGIRPCNGEINAGWSIAANTDRLYPDDRWTVQIPTEKWKEKLKDYDYVLIYRANDSFREDYGTLFEAPEEIEDRSIFAVDHDRDLLVRVQ